jgi:hypothetical protein
MPAGIGAGAYCALTFETAYGTYLPPSTAGTVFVPIISESLHYVEDKYYSPQLRQQAVVSDVKPGYYHVEGDIVMEADTNFLPYFLHASRHNIAKVGAADPWTYTYTPSTAGSATTAASGNVPRSLSIALVRNGIGFGYGGCVVGRIEVSVDDTGIMRFTFGIVGLSEQQPGGLGTPAWVADELFGADAHSVYVDVAGTAPAFASADTSFDNFTFTADHNAEAQTRLIAARSASYVSYGETEIGYTTSLDFLNRTEFDNFKASTKRAIKLESNRPSGTFAASTEAVQLTVFNSTYDAYDVGVGGIGDLIMADVTGKGLAIPGGNAYAIAVKSAVTIT